MLLSVVIPVYNEEKTLPLILEKVLNVPLKKEIIVINDGSTDKSRQKIQLMKEKYLKNKKFYSNTCNFKIINKQNKGKGSALKAGFKYAIGDIVIIQDADLELDPNDFLSIVSSFKDCNADIVFGSRFLNNKNNKKNIFYYGNKLITFVSNLFTQIKMTDVETCYKAFKIDLIKSFKIKSNGFSVDPELAAYVAKEVRKGKVFKEVPIFYFPRNYKMGKKIKLIDGLKAIYAIIRFNLF